MEKIRGLKILGFSEENTPGRYSPLKMTAPLVLVARPILNIFPPYIPSINFNRPLFYLTAQEGSVSFLLDLGVGVGVFDDTGMSAIGVMIEKMPHVAYEALNQYQDRDVARRVDQFYLNYLEQVRV